MITVLAGGIGAAKFLEGLVAVMPPEQITVIANTGDDAEIHGLHISPDMDTVLYTLAGVVNRESGWGIAGDTFHALGALARLKEETWFQLGDQDLTTHLYRTRRLREGARLSEVSSELCRRFVVRCRLIPMTNDPAATRLRTSAGELSFQEYFVKLRQEPEVLAVDLSAAECSKPAPGVIEAILDAQGVIIAPSNPIISIGPILAVPGILDALRNTPAPVAAISPIVGGKALKGPADRMMNSLGFGSSAAAVAELYRDFVDVFVLDEQDSALQAKVESKGMRALVTQTIMHSAEAKQNLALTISASLQDKR
ncbi:MAG: 2-phospho-L-lactate transferase [Acidobacteria bacterium]|nr:2-phospho-L-lactate transferase [Acidobacteriota bacterium]